jgi:hypothetical protein
MTNEPVKLWKAQGNFHKPCKEILIQSAEA